MTAATDFSSPAVEGMGRAAGEPAVNEPAAQIIRSANVLEWQRLWIRLQQTAWSSLAIVPVDATIDVRSLVTQLVTAGRQAGCDAVSSLDAANIPVSLAQEMIRSFDTTHASGERVVVACDSVAENPSTLAISRAVSGVLLVARLGESHISTAKLAVDAIGRERVLASITVQRAR